MSGWTIISDRVRHNRGGPSLGALGELSPNIRLAQTGYRHCIPSCKAVMVCNGLLIFNPGMSYHEKHERSTINDAKRPQDIFTQQIAPILA